MQAKGRTLLLGAPRHDTEQLMAVADGTYQKSAEASERKVRILLWYLCRRLCLNEQRETDTML